MKIDIMENSEWKKTKNCLLTSCLPEYPQLEQQFCEAIEAYLWQSNLQYPAKFRGKQKNESY